MDWSKIKTIFIIAFLLLDIYLIYEYTQLKESQKADDNTEESAANILAQLGIDYDKKNIPMNKQKDQYLSAKSKTFSVEELEELEKGILKDQVITIRDSINLQSVLEKPIEVEDDFSSGDLAEFLSNQVYNGTEYHFWEKKGNTITYYQQYGQKTLYRNLKGALIFNLNEENKIVSYNQTYLENIKEMDEKENIISPLEVILSLFKNSYIDSDAFVSKMELGYYTQLDTSAQLLTPTWKITVDDKNYYVNALAGEIIQPETEELKVE
ncbi:two-component system regulatory protein YycI [Bacillus sp. B1-b2]|uniref:two-component system regulatory protein YycI n=1 Tax=Bacillus sp. B1-b2 TaxID=2653201 RepID=UPI001261DD0D|nr:two-component system regulatory protein YycI [Bacillus sp. B1-b2]KAB7665282.1 hypothetical protein F9279_20905 [Bacillus sp. B1-b2]